MREYLSIQESSKVIAAEVAENGFSTNWVGNTDVARELERHLAKFNIGYTDPKRGTWEHKRNGTRYFSTMKLMNAARGKLNSIVSSMKK